MPSRTILLVDSDPLQRQLVDMLLAEDGPTIVNAGSGREALEFLKEHTPHLVIMALELPDLGGDVVCGKLKSVTRLASVPVLLTVAPPKKRAAVATDVRERARSAGADLVLPKPLGDKNLRDRVQRLLSRWDTPASGAGRSTKNTIIIEQALEALGEDRPGDDGPREPAAAAAGQAAAASPPADALYRENEELRREVTSLRRKLARLEAGLPSRDGEMEANADIVSGGRSAEPSVPDPRSPAEDAEPTREPPAARAVDEPQDRVQGRS
ncbi:MAG: response regulator [Deinococcales bacterium]